MSKATSNKVKRRLALEFNERNEEINAKKHKNDNHQVEVQLPSEDRRSQGKLNHNSRTLVKGINVNNSSVMTKGKVTSANQKISQPKAPKVKSKIVVPCKVQKGQVQIGSCTLLGD